MHSVSSKPDQKATIKSCKVCRTQPAIARKIIAFQELINLERSKKSAREAAALLEVPNSTIQSWMLKENPLQVSPELAQFFSTVSGAIFLQRVVMAAYQTIHFGCGGIRGLQEFLNLSMLDQFVASSEGALQAFSKRYEEHIVAFGCIQEGKLAENIKRRKITAGLDEMYRGRHPCLVAIEAVSGFILLEKFTDDRTTATWRKELVPRLDELNVELWQVASDLCGGIRSYAKETGAEHIPELFHALFEISKATAAPLAAQEREFENTLAEAEEKLKKIEERHGEASEKAYEARILRNCREIGLRERKERRQKVQTAKRELSKTHHPIDLKTGKLQTAEVIKNSFDMQLKIIEKAAEEAELSKSCKKRLGKARRAFDAIVGYVTFFFIAYNLFVENLKLEKAQEQFFNEVIFPLEYLKMIWRRLPRKMKEELKPLKESLENRLREAHYPEELKTQWLKIGQECAEIFQRSSSFVEGRNGLLSLYHHRFHRLNTRGLKALTIVHNFHTKRADETTAAERFFGRKHESLFESLVTNVRIPGRPQKQNHDLKKRLIGREKRMVA
jgi:hypothetical protein